MKKYLLTIGAVFAFLIASTAFAALFDAEKSLQGTISNIESNLITIDPAAADQAKMGPNVDIQVNDQTAFNAVDSLNELKEGDAIEVKYKEQEGDKVALEISRLNNAELDQPGMSPSGTDQYGTPSNIR